MTENVAQVRVLTEGDQVALDLFLAEHIASSMFLICNLAKSGFDDRGRRYDGTYAAAFDGETVVGVAAHYWNRYLIVQAPVATVAVCQAAVAASPRQLKAVIGPAQHVELMRQTLAIGAEQVQFDELEYLYTLDLQHLRVPSGLQDGSLRVRRMVEDDLPLMTDWSVGYGVETMGERDDAEYHRRCRAGLEGALKEGTTWILEDDSGQPLAQSGFNATCRWAVQVGGVWTPPTLRGRGYARAAVAGSLLAMRADGAELGILYTGTENVAAQRAYEAIGFQCTGDYRVLMLCEPMDL